MSLNMAKCLAGCAQNQQIFGEFLHLLCPGKKIPVRIQKKKGQRNKRNGSVLFKKYM